MAKVINITDKLSNDKPKIQIGEKSYEVNNSMGAVFTFQELAMTSTKESLTKAIEMSLGKEAAKEIDVEKWSLENFKVLSTAILAAMQNIDYEEAEARFQKSEGKQKLV